jgi:deoxyadenosine/deoxycytidine kinase
MSRRSTNLEEVRRIFYDAVTFAHDVRVSIASQDFERFQDLYRNMVAALPRWMETRDACE